VWRSWAGVRRSTRGLAHFYLGNAFHVFGLLPRHSTFAERKNCIEKFIDIPVKGYSSGIYVRLAFAVAAHLQPEIMLIDEVLAVGDAKFQKKSLGKWPTWHGQAARSRS
jgi:hypothetical protein